MHFTTRVNSEMISKLPSLVKNLSQKNNYLSHKLAIENRLSQNCHIPSLQFAPTAGLWFGL
jgi:hypothetical protein